MTGYTVDRTLPFLDGQIVAHDVDLYSPVNDPGGSPPEGGHYQQVLYAKDGLPAGQHTIKIVVTGDRNPLAGGTWVNIDAFVVDGPPTTGILPGVGIELIVNNFVAYPRAGLCRLPTAWPGDPRRLHELGRRAAYQPRRRPGRPRPTVDGGCRPNAMRVWRWSMP
jgi:hypothetical protein